MSLRSRRLAVPVLLAAAALFSACGSSTDPASSATSSAPSPSTSPTPAPVTPVVPALSATGPDGVTVKVTAPPKRIVCLTGICDAILADLGLTPVATATPSLATNPVVFGSKGAAIPTVPGSFGSEDPAAIAAFTPDLVVGLSGVHDALTPALRTFAPVLNVKAGTDEDSVAYLRMLATLTARPTQQQAAESAYRSSVAAAQARVQSGPAKGVRVLAMWGGTNGIGVSTTADPLGSVFTRVFDYPFPVLANDPVTSGAYSLEQILEKDPQVIFASSITFSDKDTKVSETYASNPIWKRVSAVESGAVHEVDKDVWQFCRATRCLKAAVDQALPLVEKAATTS